MKTRGYSTTILIALLVVGLVVGAGVGYLSSSNASRSKISEKEGQISVLGSEVSSLNSKVSTLEEENSNNKMQISDLESENSDLESDLDKAESTITSKEAEITGLESEISDLELMASVFKTDIEESARVTPFTLEAAVMFGNEDQGEFIYGEGVLQRKGAISSGGNITFIPGDIFGTDARVREGLETIWFVMDFRTGKGFALNKLIMTIEGRGTFEGPQPTNLMITYDEDGKWTVDFSGIWVLYGTGEFEGLMLMSSVEGSIKEVLGGLSSLTGDGFVLYPKG